MGLGVGVAGIGPLSTAGSGSREQSRESNPNMSGATNSTKKGLSHRRCVMEQVDLVGVRKMQWGREWVLFFHLCHQAGLIAFIKEIVGQDDF